MRPQTRYFVQGAAIGGIAASVIDMIIQAIELHDQRLPFWDNWNYNQTFKNGITGAAWGGVIGLAVYEVKQIQESNLPFDPNKHLHNVLMSASIKNDPVILNAALNHRNQIATNLNSVFNNKLADSPTYFGSTVKGTAINGNFDCDIFLPFKRESFGTLEEMYMSVYSTLKKDYKGFEVRKQKRSIGLSVSYEKSDLHFDIVPGRAIGDYRYDKSVNLFEYHSSVFEENSLIKSNVEIQSGVVRNRPDERKVIKLFKVYRDRNYLKLPSPVIEHFVIEAFDRRSYNSTSLFTNFKYCMEYMADKIERNGLIDISNTNNNLLESLTNSDRSCIRRQLERDLSRIYENKRYLKDIYEY